MTTSARAPAISSPLRRLGFARQRLGALGFALRLFLTLGIALLVVGAIAYVLVSQRLEQLQIDGFARAQQADVEGFELIARDADRATAIREIDEVLEAIGRRPGTTEASLVGPERVIVASSDEELEGTREDTPQIVAALESGTARYGREVDPARARRTSSSSRRSISPTAAMRWR